MKPYSKRLFINSLPANISETDLQEKFSNYGNVSSVQIKQRKNVGVNQTMHFAYIQIVIENKALLNCIDEFSNKKWKGNWLDVQEAKESFMERLKREREEQKVNGITRETQNATINNENNVESLVKNNIKKYHSSSSSENSEDEPEDSGFTSSTNSNRKRKISNSLIQGENENEIKIVKKRAVISNDTIEIESPVTETRKDELKKLNSKEMEADKKRLQSIAQMKKGYQQQKSLIKTALANIDLKPKNKIIFNDDGINESAISPSTKATKSDKSHTPSKEYYSGNSQKKLRLFNEDEDETNNEGEENYNFEIKEHFEGKKGQKLMKLQSKFKNDKRFAMDARFLEDEQSEDQQNDEVTENKEDEEISYEDEKRKELEILEEVLGKKVSRPSVKSDKATENKTPKMMLRFDPTQPEHYKFEVKDTPKQEKKKKKAKEIQNEDKVIEEAPAPEVSKDTFYKVAVDLKTALQEKEGFSLADMFSKEIEKGNEEQSPEETIINKQTKTLIHEKNPFRYDSSSDSEDEEIPPKESATTEMVSAPKPVTQQQRPGTTRLWTESFFFKPDDYRLQEGLDFIKKMEVDDQDDFHKLRRNLREIVRAKVKNNLRKNRPFKKKLGGKKRIKVKRALKR